MKRKLGVAAVLGLAAVVGWGQSGSAAKDVEAVPALWKAKGAKGTVYLFGTVHVMKKDVHWETPKVEDALKASGALWLEIGDTGDAAMKAAQPLILQLGTDPSHPLSSKLTKEDVAAVDAAVKKMGFPGEATVEPLQPWVLYVMLSVAPLQAAGYQITSGIDRVLQEKANAAGKPVMGFETTEEQIHYLADFPQADQVAMLHEELKDLPNGVQKTNEMVEDWEKGDVAKIAALENEDMMKEDPGLYKKLLVDRNVRIADKIGTMLKDPATGTVFVAIGAAHLAGPDSVLKMLEKQGFVAERVE